jgi:hypothetical protein
MTVREATARDSNAACLRHHVVAKPQLCAHQVVPGLKAKDEMQYDKMVNREKW